MVSHWIMLRMRNILDEICKENRKTHFMFNNCFPKIVLFMRYVGGGGNSMRFCLPTLTTLTRTRHRVTSYVHCLSYLFNSPFTVRRLYYVAPNGMMVWK
jgi:hypothetical protein